MAYKTAENRNQNRSPGSVFRGLGQELGTTCHCWTCSLFRTQLKDEECRALVDSCPLPWVRWAGSWTRCSWLGRLAWCALVSVRLPSVSGNPLAAGSTTGRLLNITAFTCITACWHHVLWHVPAIYYFFPKLHVTVLGGCEPDSKSCPSFFPSACSKSSCTQHI